MISSKQKKEVHYQAKLAMLEVALALLSTLPNIQKIDGEKMI